jgi:Fe-S cluster assembly scaffold protein SufB
MFPDQNTVQSLIVNKSDKKWLRDSRLSALNHYNELPLEPSPLYAKYDNILGSLELNSLSTLNELPNIPIPPTLSSNSDKFAGELIQINGSTFSTSTQDDLLKEGIIYTDLFTAINDHESLLKPFFDNRAIPSNSDKFAALNQALLNSGAFLYIPKNIEISFPFRRLSLINDSDKGIFSNLIVIVERGSSASIIDEGHGVPNSNNSNSVQSNVIEIYLDEGSKFDYHDIQAYDYTTSYFANKRAVCKKDSQITWTGAYMGSNTIRSRLDTYLQGIGSTTSSIEIVFGTDGQRFDILSDLTHRDQNTIGSNIVRGVMKTKAQALIKGMIRIDQNAKNSKAYLSEHAMLLDKESFATAIPGLEVSTNDVKATHACSVAQIDPELLFYVMSRGLNYDDAKRVLVLGFFEPAIQRIPLKDLREMIRKMVRNKWDHTALISDIDKDDLIESPNESEDDSLQSEKSLFEHHYKYR